MFTFAVKVTAPASGSKKLLDSFRMLGRQQVLVGIPSDGSTRSPVNNATLLFWHTLGSPRRGYPARPVIEPALQADRELIGKQAAKVARALASGSEARATEELNKLGALASNRIRNWFTDPRNGWPPNSYRAMSNWLLSILEKQTGKKIPAGTSYYEFKEHYGGAPDGVVRPLIFSGALRRAITWVPVKELTK